MTESPHRPDQQHGQGPPPAGFTPPPPPPSVGASQPGPRFQQGQRPPGPPPQSYPGGQGPPPQGPPPPPPGQWGQPPQAPWGPYAGPPPGGGWGGPPPSQAPDPRGMRRSPIPLIVGLVVLMFVLMVVLVPVLASMGSTGGGPVIFGDKVALLEVEGMLGEGPAYPADTARLKELVEKWTEDDSIKGMVVRVNSPGGAVSATQDLYHAIERFRESKPVYVSMGDVAASGGYYIAMAGDRIHANSGTITGSIGVIMSMWKYQELADKIGVMPRVIKSGEFKDIGSGARDITPEERELLEEMIMSVYEEFFDVVVDGRSQAARRALAEELGMKAEQITDDQVRDHLTKYCDGRVFSGAQAVETGMVDDVASLDQTIEALKQELGITKEVRLVRTPDPQPGLFGTMTRTMTRMQEAPGTMKLEFRFTM